MSDTPKGFNLSQYLKKFEHLLPYEVRVRNAVIWAIQEVLSITITRSQVSVSGSRVFITAPAALKSEIVLKQEKLLAKVREKETDLVIQRIQ
jgi:hypothetical protein